MVNNSEVDFVPQSLRSVELTKKAKVQLQLTAIAP